MSGDIGMYEIYGDPDDNYEDPNEDPNEVQEVQGLQKLIKEYLDKKETGIVRTEKITQNLIRSQTKLILTISIITLLSVSIIAISICYSYFGNNTNPSTTSTTTTTPTPENALLIGGKELWAPNKFHCLLKGYSDTQILRWYQSQIKNIVCGGYNGGTNCVRYDAGSWGESHNLTKSRIGHIMWKSSQGIMIIGGGEKNDTETPRTTELLLDNGTSDLGWNVTFNKYACALQLEEYVLISGGDSFTETEVSSNVTVMYDVRGQMTKFPDLNVARKEHACSHYIDDNDKRVYLVTGGYADDNSSYISSTEILRSPYKSWEIVETGELKTGLRGSTAATLDNTIFLLGGKWKNNDKNDTSYFSKYIYMFNNSKRKWVFYDNMRDNYAFSSVGLVNLEEMKPFCKNNKN